jgi:hypothetical protein
MAHEVLLVVPGAGDESIGHKALIEAETTAADLLRAANLNPTEWQLQRKQGDSLVSLGNQDKIADHVQAGEKVFAFMSEMVVGLTA